MKPYLCWLLTGLLLLTGCVQPQGDGDPQEARPTVTVTYYSEPTAVAPAAELPDVAGYDDFMSVLSAAVLDGTGNKNLSPVSVYIALSMAAEGARGETQGELLALLGAQDATDMRRTAQELLSSLEVRGETGEIALADSLWLGEQDERVRFYEAYLDVLRDSYGAEARSVPFGDPAAGEEIAAWIREKTREKINISEDAMRFDADTLAVLINTVFLKDGWREPFHEDRTEQGVFHGLNGKEGTADYMRRTDKNVTIVRGKGFLRYSLPLNEVGRMVFVLPDEDVTLSGRGFDGAQVRLPGSNEPGGDPPIFGRSNLLHRHGGLLRHDGHAGVYQPGAPGEPHRRGRERGGGGGLYPGGHGQGRGHPRGTGEGGFPPGSSLPLRHRKP